MYNTLGKIVINFHSDEGYETLILDEKTLEVVESRKEGLFAFFKCVYNTNSNDWYILDFTPSNEEEKDFEKKYKSGTFELKKIVVSGAPISFDRDKFLVDCKGHQIDVWEESIR